MRVGGFPSSSRNRTRRFARRAIGVASSFSSSSLFLFFFWWGPFSFLVERGRCRKCSCDFSCGAARRDEEEDSEAGGEWLRDGSAEGTGRMCFGL